jgi:hypothetical protein
MMFSNAVLEPGKDDLDSEPCLRPQQEIATKGAK